MRCYRCGLRKGPGRCGNCGVSGSTYCLSDMDVDEVSFVQSGANPHARIVLHKSEDQAVATGTKLWSLLAVARELQEANPGLNVAQAISKALDDDPDLYDPDMPPWQPPEPVQKSGLSFELEAAAERVQAAYPTWTVPQCIAKALDDSPELYEVA